MKAPEFPAKWSSTRMALRHSRVLRSSRSIAISTSSAILATIFLKQHVKRRGDTMIREIRGIMFEIPYRGLGRLDDDPVPDAGIGRVYQPFTGSQLKAALRNPGSTPGLLPSFTAAPPLAINEHLQYLDRASVNQAQAAPPAAGSTARFVSSTHRNSLPSDVGNWIASMAGVDPTNPTQPRQSAVGASGGNPTTPQRLLPPWVFFGSP